MQEIKEISTRYKVLDIREEIGNNQKPIVLICQEHKDDYRIGRRRRIEVYSFDEKAYEDAKLIVPGDIILVHESFNKNGFGGHIIEEIEC